MTTVTIKDSVEIFCKDRGPTCAQPIAFHRGRLLSSDDREKLVLFFGGAS